MANEVAVSPSFTIRHRDDEELGEVFLDVASRIVASSGVQTNAHQVVQSALTIAAVFTEAVAQLQREQD